MKKLAIAGLLVTATLGCASEDLAVAQSDAAVAESSGAPKADAPRGFCDDIAGTYDLVGCNAVAFPLRDNVVQPSASPYGGKYEIWAMTTAAPVLIEQVDCTVTLSTQIAVWKSQLAHFDCGSHQGLPSCVPEQYKTGTHTYSPGSVTEPWDAATDGTRTETVAWLGGPLEMREGFAGLASPYSQAQSAHIDRDGEKISTTFTPLTGGDLRVTVFDGPAATWSDAHAHTATCTLERR